MKTLSVALLLCLAVPVVVLCAASTTKTSAKARPGIDVGKPDTWEGSIKRANQNLSEIADALISVAKDERRPAAERRKAIFLLGNIGSRKSLAFLIENVPLPLPMPITIGDEDLLKETPCVYALCKGDWNAAEGILDSLRKPKSKTDIMLLAHPLERVLSRKVAIAAVEEGLSQKPTKAHKANLESMKKFLLE